MGKGPPLILRLYGTSRAVLETYRRETNVRSIDGLATPLTGTGAA